MTSREVVAQGRRVRLLITGTGRCGTGFLAAALTAAGVQCGHEQAFTRKRHGHGAWAAEASWLAAPYLTALDDTYVVHLVRDPLKVIASFAARATLRVPNRMGRFIMRHTPVVADATTQVERAGLHYVAWNRMIAHAPPDEVLRLEDVTASTITRLARMVVPGAGLCRLPAPSNTTPEPVPELGWASVEHIPGLVGLASEYGYTEAADAVRH